MAPITYSVTASVANAAAVTTSVATAAVADTAAAAAAAVKEEGCGERGG